MVVGKSAGSFSLVPEEVLDIDVLRDPVDDKATEEEDPDTVPDIEPLLSSDPVTLPLLALSVAVGFSGLLETTEALLAAMPVSPMLPLLPPAPKPVPEETLFRRCSAGI